MQTFLPLADFGDSARSLDRQRLGKQRVETLQILRALDRSREYGWRSHPVVRMWAGYPDALVRYGLTVCAEWTSRGYQDTCAEKLRTELAAGDFLRHETPRPPWLGDENLHRSHRAALVHKLPEHYAPLFGDLIAEEYVWPSPTTAQTAVMIFHGK